MLRSDMRNDSCRPCFLLHPTLANYNTRIDATVKLGDGKRYFGVELETESTSPDEKTIQNHLCRIDEIMGENVIMKRDGSLRNGIEIVTRPATKEKQYMLWDKFLTEKHPGLISWSSDRCGMHVHVSREGLSENTIAKAVCFVNSTSNKKFIFVIAGRKDNGYAIYKAKTLEEASKFNGQRHEAVNLSNEDTIEFRLFKGTLKKESVYKNIEFTDALLEFCAQPDTSLDQAMSRASFIRFVRQQGQWPHLLSFIMSRWFGKPTELSQQAGWVTRKNCTVTNEIGLTFDEQR
jgi:hypothetical protein